MTILICDDDVLQRQRTLAFLNSYLSVFPLGADTSCQTISPKELGESMLDLTFHADLLLLDIEMQEFNGIELAQEINRLQPDCHIIFLTSFLEYASYVYEAKHLYFVLKSQMEEMLPKALKKAADILTDTGAMVPLPISGETVHIPAGKVFFIEKEGHNSKIFTESSWLITSLSLKSLLGMLGTDFIRCHGGYIVNLRNVSAFTPTAFQLKNHIQVPIGRTFQKNAKKAYLEYLAMHL